MPPVSGLVAALLLLWRGADAGVDDGWAAFPPAAAAPEREAAAGWTALSDTGCPHAGGSVVVLDGPPRLLVAGGVAQRPPETVTPCAETLSLPAAAGAKWAPAAPLLLPRAAHAAATINGTAFVFGGHLAKDPTAPPSEAPKPTATAETLGPAGWLPAPPLPGPRTGVRAASLPDGRALLVGGFEGAPPNWSYLNTTLFADGRGYTPGPELPCPAGPSPKCGLSNIGVQECAGSVFAIGGSGLEPSFATVWRLDAADPTEWVAAPALPAPMSWVGTGCVEKAGGGGTLFTVGGFGGTFEPSSATLSLELGEGGKPSTSGWQQSTALPGVRAQVAAAGSNGTLFAIGGLGAGLADTAADMLSVGSAPAEDRRVAAVAPQQRMIGPGGTLSKTKQLPMPVVTNGYIHGMYHTRHTPDDTTAAFKKWFAAGGRGVDTAHMYNNQAQIGQAIRESGVPRSELFVTTKILCTGDAASALAMVQDDLKELGLQQADLVLIHGTGKVAPYAPGDPISYPGNCSDMTRLTETYVGLEQALEMNLTRAIGVSNHQIPHLKAVMAVARHGPPAVNQMRQYAGYHRCDQTWAFCRDHGITYMAYSPLGPINASPKPVLVDKTVLAVAKAHNVSAATVAFGWLAQRNATLTTASNNPTYDVEDLAIGSLEMTAAEMRTLDELHIKDPTGAPYSCKSDDVATIAGLALALLPTTAAVSLDVTPERTTRPLRSVSPHYISFALDNAFVRDPTGISGVVLPQDATNSTRIDFQDPLLNKIMPLVSGGFIRIGGTYTDFVRYYVPGSNESKPCPYKKGWFHGPHCPGNSLPCCLPLTMERWSEALEAAHRWGMRVTFNLNLLHGRYEDYSSGARHYPTSAGGTALPPWDSSEARSLLEWTAANIKPELWPVAFGLGNELNGYMTPEAWAQDMITTHGMIRDVFGKHRKPQISSEAAGLLRAASERAEAAAVPSTYGPCNGPQAIGDFSSEFMNNITALGKNALGAFSFHGYQHPDSTVAAVADMVGRGGIDASREYFETVNANHKSANTESQLWITETAWSASAPAGAPEGGRRAAIDGMCRAADIAWNLDALGAAAEAGVDVFCRETLAGMQPLSRSTQWSLQV